MNNSGRGTILIAGMLFVMLLMGYLLISNQKNIPTAQKICENLIEEALLDDCPTGHTSISALDKIFPLEETDINYVMTGMASYSLVKDSARGQCHGDEHEGQDLRRLYYDAQILSGYIIEFTFCGDTLVYIYPDPD